LRRLGAIALNGVQILPDREECLETFQWLRIEVQQAKGEALLMRVDRFEGLSDRELIERFQAARREDYAQLNSQAEELAQVLEADNHVYRENLEKLYKQHTEIGRIDFFNCPEGIQVLASLDRIARLLSPPESTVEIESEIIDRYRDKQWVTRPKPHVDRLACIWLIRRFINPNAVIRYARQAAPDEIAFDMNTGKFKHQSNLCTFEVMLRVFGLNDPGLQIIAEIVHEIDLRDGRYLRPQTPGIEDVLKGWLLAQFSNETLEMQGIALFEGLYLAHL
jgi:hypothetical protein